MVSVWAFMFAGIFIGAMRAVEMRNSMMISLSMVFLPVWYPCNHGPWLVYGCARADGGRPVCISRLSTAPALYLLSK
jgi:hypothetical protein